MNRLPAEIRALTPAETFLLIAGWNAAQNPDGMPKAMSADRLNELKRMYPDE